MRIVGAAVLPFALPLRAAPPGVGAHRRGFILRLESEDGLCGVGEASPATWVGGEPVAAVGSALATVRALVSARPAAADLEARLATLTPAARCAVDTALLDLAARRAGQSVAATLGTRAEAEVDVSALLAAENPDDLATEAAARIAQGYRTLKLKIGGRPEAAEVQRVAAARHAAGAGIGLRLDANRAFAFAAARRMLAALAPFDVAFVEEPLARPTPRALARLRRDAGIAIALDESVGAAADLAPYLDADAVDAIVLKAARLGGLRAALAVVRAAAGRTIVVTDSLESAVGRSAAVHLAAAAGATVGVGLGGAVLLGADVVPEPPDRDRPRLRAPAPGLGVVPSLAEEAGDA